MTLAPFRIAVAAGYMPFFNEIMPQDYPADRDAYGRSLAQAAEAAGDVTYLGLVDDGEAGRRAGIALSALDADAVLLAPTMATPANYLWNVVEPNPKLPVVIWSAHETGTIAPGYDMVELCRHSQNVGALMAGNMLARHGRPFVVVTGEREDPAVRDELADKLRVAALAGRLRRSRIGRLGHPLDGYANVDVDPDALRQSCGMEVIDIGLDEWNDALSDADDEAIDSVLADVDRYASLDPGRDAPQARAAARMAAALGAVSRRHDLIAGGLNCRGAFGVGNAVSLSLGCLALTHAAATGVPFACTGDLITAIAMAIGSALGGATLYCELDAIDTTRDAFLCANTGEGDPRWGRSRTDCRIFEAGAASGRRAPGCSVRQVLSEGEATMIGFTPRAGAPGGFVLIAMEGQVQEAPKVALSVTSAWFQADTKPMRRAFSQWAEAGATHHGSLTPGRQARRLELLARFLGIGFEQV